MKELVEMLREDDLMASLINNLPSLFFIQKPNGYLLYCNQIMEQMTGYDFNEIVDKHYLDFFYPEDHNEVSKVNSMALKYGYSEAESRIKLKNGGERHVLLTASKFNYNNNRYIVGNLYDISVRLKVENDLKLALEKINGLKEKLQQENTYLREELDANFQFEEIVGQNKKLQEVFKQIQQVAQTDASVLIQGDTGTGKELIARAIHKLSIRSKKTMVKINCASIPAALLESELFGHEKGSFTGALSRKMGRFEVANNGTLFLDEVGELPLELQPKLLRVLQDGEFERIGGVTTLKSNVRIIAATNRDLEKEVETGNFRSDLYFRLNVFPIKIPALKERKDDIEILAMYFIEKFNQKYKKSISKLTANGLQKFKKYDWPGNIRELQNIIERAVITSLGNTLDISSFSFPDSTPLKPKTKLQTLHEVEKEHILKTLDFTHWRIRGKSGAAEILNTKPTTLEYRMKKLGISRKK